MKKLILLALCLVPVMAWSQTYMRLDPYGSRSKTMRMQAGEHFAYIASATDTAKDNAKYLAPIAADLGNDQISYGVNILVRCDTVASLQLVLEASFDSVAWAALDSIACNPGDATHFPASYLGTRSKTVDLAAYRYPYWRLRWGLGGASDDFRSSGSTPNGAGGTFYFFVIANFLGKY